MDRPDCGFFVVYETRIRPVPPTGQYQSALLAAARQVLQGSCLVPENGDDSGLLEGETDRTVRRTQPLGNHCLGGQPADGHANQPGYPARFRPDESLDSRNSPT